MRHEFRLGRGARWFGALGVTLALAAVPSAASAQSTLPSNFGAGTPNIGFDPEYTNTPFLAWNGETQRLEECIPNDYGVTNAELKATNVRASFAVQAWTGNQSDATTLPQFNSGSVKVFVSQDYSAPDDPGVGGICAMGDVTANTPGLAEIYLTVSADTSTNGGASTPGGPDYSLLSHQFLAAWMQLNQPTLTAQSGSMNAGDGTDPLDVKVTGTIPLQGNSSIMNQVGQGSLTLPGDWALMASKLAVDESPNNGTYGGRNAEDDWDTSGESQNVSGNGAFSGCPAPITSVSSPFDSGAYIPTYELDNGDNCTGGDEFGPFSTSTGLSSDGGTIGPFDPTNAQATSLPDGDLNSQDAPMPAALIDVAIGQNTGSGTSGMGSLVAADKTQVDSRDGAGDSTKNNLYAPFYDAYIPATARPTDNSSGTDGAYGSNYTGFLDIPNANSNLDQFEPYVVGDPGLYHFWDAADLNSNTGAATDCLQYGDDPPAGSNDPGNEFRSGPDGAYEADVYTDQNGEAMIDYVPGTGAYYDNMGADKNADGGCDLESQGTNGITSLGSSTITATAEYPYEPEYPVATSTATTINVTNQFDKSLSYEPKGTSQSDQVSRIVIAHGVDVDGSPLSGETVCFSVDSNAEGVTRFTGTVGGVYYGDSQSTTDPNGASQGRTCLITDSAGNAAIEVLDSNQNSVNVIADWVNEGILRDKSVPFTTGSPTTGGTPPTTGVTPPSSGGDPTTTTTQTTTTQTITTVQSAAAAAPTPAAVNQSVATPTPQQAVAAGLAPTIASHKATAAKSTVQFVRFLTTTKTRYAVIRVNSKSHTVTLVLTLQEGHKIVHRTITLATNRTVKLSLGKSVTKIKGSHLIG